MINHKLNEPFASFEDDCAQTWIFSITPFNIRGNHVLVHGAEKGVTSVFMYFKSFKYVGIVY